MDLGQENTEPLPKKANIFQKSLQGTLKFAKTPLVNEKRVTQTPLSEDIADVPLAERMNLNRKSEHVMEMINTSQFKGNDSIMKELEEVEQKINMGIDSEDEVLIPRRSLKRTKTIMEDEDY